MPSDIDQDRNRVVVGVDGSESSQHALRWAAHFAAGTNSVLAAVATWEYPTSFSWGPAPLPTDWDPRSDVEKLLTQSVDAVFGTDRPETLQLVVAEGDPARILLEHSTDALLLVVGSRGLGGFSGLMLGSVSAYLAHHAKCSVLVVHGDREPVRAAG